MVKELMNKSTEEIRKESEKLMRDDTWENVSTNKN